MITRYLAILFYKFMFLIFLSQESVQERKSIDFKTVVDENKQYYDSYRYYEVSSMCTTTTTEAPTTTLEPTTTTIITTEVIKSSSSTVKRTTTSRGTGTDETTTELATTTETTTELTTTETTTVVTTTTAISCDPVILANRAVNSETIPYQVALRERVLIGLLWFTFCVGALVTPKYVLTAAHCLDNRRTRSALNKLMVVAGTTRTNTDVSYMLSHEQYSRINEYYPNDKFRRATYLDNIGLIEVKNSFKISNKVMPIRLHTPDLDLKLEENLTCAVSGFGKLEQTRSISTHLKVSCVQIISTMACQVCHNAHYLNKDTICTNAHEKYSCDGVSGGPLVCEGVLVGLLSWGGECGASGGVYTRVQSYADGESRMFSSTHPNGYIDHVLLLRFCIVYTYQCVINMYN